MSEYVRVLRYSFLQRGSHVAQGADGMHPGRIMAVLGRSGRELELAPIASDGRVLESQAAFWTDTGDRFESCGPPR